MSDTRSRQVFHSSKRRASQSSLLKTDEEGISPILSFKSESTPTGCSGPRGRGNQLGDDVGARVKDFFFFVYP